MKVFIFLSLFALSLPISAYAATADSDGDGLSDELEAQFQTDPQAVDSDGDTYMDGEEIFFGYSPTSSDATVRLDRRLDVNLSTQHMNLVVAEQVVRTIPVSTGNPKTPTPLGEYKIFRKVPIARYVGVDYNLPNVKWNLEFKPSYFIHTAYWHNDFGKRTRSHGCVNIRLDDAAFLYKHIDVGVPVVVSGQTPKKRTVGT